MRVKINQSIGFDPRYSKGGAVVEVDDATAEQWIRRELAEKTSEKATEFLADGTPDVKADEADEKHVAERELKDLKGEAARIAAESTGRTGHNLEEDEEEVEEEDEATGEKKRVKRKKGRR